MQISSRQKLRIGEGVNSLHNFYRFMEKPPVTYTEEVKRNMKKYYPERIYLRSVIKQSEILKALYED